MKSIFASAPAGKQLLLLLLLMLFGSIFFSFIGIGISLALWGTDVSYGSSPDPLRLIQFFSALGTFFLPALGMACLCGAGGCKPYLFLRMPADGWSWGRVFASMFLLSPTITLTSLLNEQLRLPGWLAPVERWMMEQEELMRRTTELLFDGGGAAPLLSNLVVIAATAALAEEFFFRGALTRLLGRAFRSRHAIVWTSAALFSAFHLQFYGFVPRMLLGAYFGYLLFSSKSIWLPVFGHFVNNAVAVVGMSFEPLKEQEWVTGDINPSELLPYSALATACLVLFFLLNGRVFREDSPED